MKVHISLNVSNLDESVEFYKKMLASEPAKHFPAGSTEHRESGYAKFDLEQPPLNLALNETATTKRGGLSHLGIELGTTEDVASFQKRWEESGLIIREEKDVACCYAMQDKAWVKDPDGNEWEAFTVLENVENVASTTECCDVDEVSSSRQLPVVETCC